DGREPEQPQREIHEVYAEVDHAATPGIGLAVEPRGLWAVGVVEHEIHGEHPPDATGPDDALERLDGGGVTVREVDAEQAIGGTCGAHHPAGLVRGPGERLLAEHRIATRERRETVIRMER